MAGIEDRAKYRLRVYDIESKWVKFEVKIKNNETITKETAVISREDAEQIQAKNYDIMLKYKNQALNKAYTEFKQGLYCPVALIDYLREAFTYDANNIRIVFDRFLKSSTTHLNLFSHDPSLVLQLPKGIVVMEIKYDGFIPDWIRKIIQVRSFERSAVSKYCIGRLDRFETIF